jgi:sec-independent protein translocase protein TatA
MFGAPGVPELLIICFILLLLFGKRLPGMMRSIGQSVVEFKKGVNETDDKTLDDSDKE